MWRRRQGRCQAKKAIQLLKNRDQIPQRHWKILMWCTGIRFQTKLKYKVSLKILFVKCTSLFFPHYLCRRWVFTVRDTEQWINCTVRPLGARLDWDSSKNPIHPAWTTGFICYCPVQHVVPGFQVFTDLWLPRCPTSLLLQGYNRKIQYQKLTFCIILILLSKI